jgi:hypothetical protein
VVLEFLDFYREGAGKRIKYVVFDSKFTTLENLARIDKKGVKFVTIQRRSKNLNAKIEKLSKSFWETIRVEKSNHKSRTVTYAESMINNARYGKDKLRQIFIKGSSLKPAIIITNDFGSEAADIIRKYAKRWLIENEISEQIQFFHLNRNNSGIVSKVDFDLTMSILAHNLYRLLALDLPGYRHCKAHTLYDSFIDNYGDIEVNEEDIIVKMNRKRSLPLLKESLPKQVYSYSWLGGKKLVFTANNHT